MEQLDPVLLTIEIDQAKLDAALAEYADKLKKSMEAAGKASSTTATDKQTKATTKLTEGQRLLEKAYLSSLKPFEKTATILNDLERKTDEATKKTIKYTTAVDQLTEKMNDQQRRHEANNGRSLSMLFDELGKKMGTAAGSAGQAGLAFGSLGGVVAGMAAGLVALAVSAGRSIDAIDDLSQSTGLSAVELSKFRLVSTYVDGGIETLAKGFERLAQLQADAIQGNEQAIKTLERVGITGRTDATDAILMVADAFDRMGNTAERSGLASALFGDRLARELTPALSGGSAAIQELIQRNKELGLELSGPALEAASKYEQKVAEVHARFDALVERMGTAVLSGAFEFWDDFTKGPAVERAIDEFRSYEGIMTRLLPVQKGVGDGTLLMAGHFDRFTPKVKEAKEAIVDLAAAEERATRAAWAAFNARQKELEALEADRKAQDEWANQFADYYVPTVVDGREAEAQAIKDLMAVYDRMDAKRRAAQAQTLAEIDFTLSMIGKLASGASQALDALYRKRVQSSSDTADQIRNIEQELSGDISETQRKMLEYELKVLKQRQEENEKAEVRLFYLNQAAALVEIAMSTAQAAMAAAAAAAKFGTPAAIAAAAVMTALGAIQAGIVLAQKPPGGGGGGSASWGSTGGASANSGTKGGSAAGEDGADTGGGGQGSTYNVQDAYFAPGSKKTVRAAEDDAVIAYKPGGANDWNETARMGNSILGRILGVLEDMLAETQAMRRERAAFGMSSAGRAPIAPLNQT